MRNNRQNTRGRIFFYKTNHSSVLQPFFNSYFWYILCILYYAIAYTGVILNKLLLGIVQTPSPSPYFIKLNVFVVLLDNSSVHIDLSLRKSFVRKMEQFPNNQTLFEVWYVSVCGKGLTHRNLCVIFEVYYFIEMRNHKRIFFPIYIQNHQGEKNLIPIFFQFQHSLFLTLSFLPIHLCIEYPVMLLKGRLERDSWEVIKSLQLFIAIKLEKYFLKQVPIKFKNARQEFLCNFL